MIKNYKPIACGLYDELEARAIIKQRSKITFIDDSGGIQTVEDLIYDLFAKDKVEYLKTKSGLEIRLDNVKEVDGILFNENC